MKLSNFLCFWFVGCTVGGDRGVGAREIKGREAGEERAGSGRSGYGRREVLSPLSPPTVLVKEK